MSFTVERQMLRAQMKAGRANDDRWRRFREVCGALERVVNDERFTGSITLNIRQGVIRAAETRAMHGDDDDWRLT